MRSIVQRATIRRKLIYFLCRSFDRENAIIYVERSREELYDTPFNDSWDFTSIPNSHASWHACQFVHMCIVRDSLDSSLLYVCTYIVRRDISGTRGDMEKKGNETRTHVSALFLNIFLISLIKKLYKSDT